MRLDGLRLVAVETLWDALRKVSFSVMLCGYGREGDLGGSEVMFDLMSNDLDRRPDVVALNSLLDACVRNGDVRRAVQILEQVLRPRPLPFGLV